MNHKTTTGADKYYIVTNTNEGVIIKILVIKQVSNRPNDPCDDEIITDWMMQNHYDLLDSFSILELDALDEFVIIDENYCVET